MSKVSELTHDEIAEVGARWIKAHGYPIAFSNMTSAIHGEQPDALGMDASGNSFLLEAKVSRADFFADQKKPWRQEGEGIGSNRGYITPKGLLKPEEIPYGWWLLEVHGKTKPMVKIIKGVAYEMGWDTWDIKQGREGDPKYKKRLRVARNCTWDEMNHFAKDWKEKSYREELMWMIKVFRRAADDGLDLSVYGNGKITNQRYREASNGAQ